MMFIDFTAILFFTFALEIFLQRSWISVMHSLKIEQVTKLYGPSWHEKTKMGTPTMGGIVFIPVLLLKYSPRSSDGLKSLQKLALQVAVTLPWALWVSEPPFVIFPGFEVSRLFYVALVTFVGVGLQNAVNVTDGLDGLAAGCALISFMFALSFIDGGPTMMLIIAAACGICLGFLWHNANPASVFMGDVGAHFLAGLLLSVCLNSGVLIFVIPLGFFFGVEILSVTIQIIAIRCFHRKVFKMSPIHHHFEMSGWKETQIVTRFWVMHIIGICLLMSLLFYFALRNF